MTSKVVSEPSPWAVVDGLGQRGLRVVHENAQVRRSAAQRIPGLGRGSRVDPRVPGEDLQQKAPAFRARLHATGPLRTTSKGCRYAATFSMSFPRHREIYRPMWSFFPPRRLGATTAAAPTHRLDEFQAGYSLAVC